MQTVIEALGAAAAIIAALSGLLNRGTLQAQGTPSNGVSTAAMVETIASDLKAVADKLDSHLAEVTPLIEKAKGAGA